MSDLPLPGYGPKARWLSAYLAITWSACDVRKLGFGMPSALVSINIQQVCVATTHIQLLQLGSRELDAVIQPHGCLARQ